MANRPRPHVPFLLLAVGVVLFLTTPSPVGARSLASAGATVAAGGVTSYRIDGVSTREQRTAIAGTGAVVDPAGPDAVIVRATPAEARAIAALGYRLLAVAGTPLFPPGDENYHDYAETQADLAAVAAAHPDIVSMFSIGRSYENRDLWAVKISDHVATDEAEPEVLFDGLHHAREHLTVEEALSIVHLLADNYATNSKVRKIVNSREVYVLPMLNPDGGEFDIQGNTYHYWRKNRQPNPGSSAIGTDLNRNYDYKWDCCGGSSDDPASETYHGPTPASSPEVAAYQAFVEGRVIGGVQQITTGISFHTYGELVMWPYGYTFQDIPPDMTKDDHDVFVAMGMAMAGFTCRNGDCYTPQQSSDLYITDGSNLDWMYGAQHIFAFTIEMYPSCCDFYQPDEVIPQQTRRLQGAILYLLLHAQCPYEVIGKSCP